MQEVFEKILEKLGKKRAYYNAKYESLLNRGNLSHEAEVLFEAYNEAIEIVKQAAAEWNNGWIPCTKEMPPVETEVFILAKRKFKDGGCRYIRTTAMHEDGTVSECDSCWRWEDIEGEWDEENDCYIIPEGWWEHRHYNPDEVYNNAVDDEVIAWQPLPEPYQPNGESQIIKEASRIDRMTQERMQERLQLEKDCEIGYQPKGE